MTPLSDDLKSLLDAPEYAVLATIDPDGLPRLSVAWVARQGEDVIFSTVRGCPNTVNLERDPRASVLMYPADDPTTVHQVRGSVTLSDDPSSMFFNALSRKYVNRDDEVDEDDEDDETDWERLVVRVHPTDIQ